MHAIPNDLPPAVLNPTDEDILEVTTKVDLLKDESKIHTCYNLQDGRYVKVSSSRHGGGLEEARVMHFIRIHTDIPVPRVHMVFERAGDFYNVMDHIPGDRLSRIYGSSAEDLQNIARQLAEIIQQIKSLSIPQQSVIGSWNARPFQNTWFKPLPWHQNVAPSSVFSTVTEFNDYWIRRSKLRVSSSFVDNTKIVLSHGDLNGANIIVRNGEIAAILDWDTFGWYPEFWELIPPRIWVRGGDKWLEALDRTFGPESEMVTFYKALLISAFSQPG
ncbi:kinase-like protein [Pholiota conissans]|uniref:Kinase-like protein n=1 Tax=Pholiota conissans TaxID=109636 RepID=A0A9P5Z4F8_9AGAR|nr:kinase-like protein [Pholiota conissans]